MSMKAHIETYGCQMNDYDSAMIGSILTEAGYDLTTSPETADVVIVNTCCVRDRAEQRALGRLRHLAGMKKTGAILGVVGCLAQRLAGELPRAVRGIDFVVGTDAYETIADVVAQVSLGRKRIETGVDSAESYDSMPRPDRSGICELVGIMRGCDNYCSYCIVPYVRGRERSRPVARVVEEISRLAALGLRDVTLIGQNVNSYRDDVTDFAELLSRVNAISGLSRIRFATSHPKDLSGRLIETVAGLDKVCEHIHLPFQSGSDAVLGRMRRSYTRSDYLDLVGRIRDAIEGVAVTTDVIVGFPGETEEDFESTYALMEEVRFDSAFMFRYSPRPGTSAAMLEDDVPEETKIDRLKRIIQLQRRTTEHLNRGVIGHTVEVLVEGPSEKDTSRLFGKTRTAKPVVFEGGGELAGSLVFVRIADASAWTLHGDLSEDGCLP